MLPAKLAAVELPEAENAPQLPLRIGHVLSERAMQAADSDIAICLALHMRPIPLPTSPLKGEESVADKVAAGYHQTERLFFCHQLSTR